MRGKKSQIILELLGRQEFKQWVIKPTEENNYFWQTWMAQSDTKRDAALAARDIIKGVKFNKYEMDLKEELLDEIINDARKTEYGIRLKPISGWRVAAVVATLITVGLLAYMFSGAPYEGDHIETIAQLVVRTNPPGQKSIINLPDGSVVNLNANSTLSYSTDFESDRKLTLDGEAFFKVISDPQRPFRVSSRDLVTTALGTAFNVNTRFNKERIVLIEGKIKVERKDNRSFEILNEFQKISFNKMDGFSRIESINTDAPVLWTDGVIHFRDTPLSEVVETLEDWYAVDIEITGDYSKLIYSGEFKNEYLSNILQSMKFSMDVEYEIKGKNVKLKIE